METLIPVLLTIVIFAILMAGMAVGVIFSNRELKGSCGGSGADDCFCERNGLPKACEQEGAELPSECSDPEHGAAVQGARLVGQKIVLD
jgi:hypothetical protein